MIARSRQSDITLVKKLNCWGSELTDVSIIRRMQGVEVLAFSVNQISTLAPFEDCVNLKELYLRKNNIQDINDIYYLQNLPKLTFLWLDENPCVETAGPNYRPFVLRVLPHLKKLDNVEVTPEEVQEAMRNPVQLAPQAQKFDEQPPNNQWQQESSPVRESQQQPQPHHQSPDNTESECISDPMERQSSPSSPSQEQRNASAEYSPAETNHPPSPRYQNNARGQQYDQYHGSDQELNRSGNRQMAPSVSTQSMKEYYQNDYGRTDRQPPANYRHSQMDLTEWEENSQAGAKEYSTPRRGQDRPDLYAYRNGNSSREELDDSYDRRRAEVKRAENRFNDTASVISNTVLNHLHSIHRRPVNRNSNLLSATLCLVKELDYTSLEVVEHAVRCRIDELSE